MNYTTETKKLRLALDTNILVYIEGVNGISRQRNATQTVAKLPRGNTFVPAQVLGELFRVLVGKAKFPREKARATIINYLELFPIIDTSPAILKSAADLSVNH
ncbi:MAG: PIN domain-containing protein, partial [Terriglobales bacterium]